MTTAETILQVELELLDESPYNRRSDWGDLEDLAQSLQMHGQLQPVTARRYGKGKRFELVTGHRRYRAALAAKWKSLAVRVVDVDDRTALEHQVVENAKRENVHPMDEAAAFEELLQMGRSVEDVATSFGLTVRHVQERCKLLALVPEARALFREGKFSADVAFLIARIEDRGNQEAAAKEIASGTTHPWEEPYSLEDAREMIREKYLLALKSATFPLDDADLVAAAGACSACPKRSGAQQQLFSDAAGEDLCLDGKCFDVKTRTHFARAQKQAKKDGLKILKKGDVQTNYLGEIVGKYVDVTEVPHGKKKSVRELLGDKLPTPALVQDAHGGARLVVDRAAAERAMAAAGVIKATPSLSDSDRKWREQQRREKEKRRLAKVALEEVLTELHDHADALTDDTHLLDALTSTLIHRSSYGPRKYSDEVQATLQRRDLKVGPKEDLRAIIAQAPAVQRRSFLLEVILREAYRDYDPPGDRFATAAGLLGLDFAGTHKRLVAEAAAKRKAKAKKATPEKAKKAAPAKPKSATAKKAPRKKRAKKPASAAPVSP